ncbi:MAG: LCP family protein, partial [Caldilineae bacterium]|nr:LCP family protein [Caldilineae bacterium]
AAPTARVHAQALRPADAVTAADATDAFFTRPRPVGWTYRLRLWNDLGRAYALRGLPPPLPADLRAAAGGGLDEPPGPRDRAETLDLLLLGSDRRSGDGPWRTDTLLLASLDRETGRVGLISIPRDLWVSIPGYGAGRINTADYLGHVRGLPDGQLIRDTVALNLGLEVDHFVRVDLQGFVAVVEQLGGIDVPVDCPIEDFFHDPTALGGEQALDLDTGLHHLDGEMALRYVRSRWRSSDFDRSRRQQRALRAAMASAREAGFLRRAPRLWKALEPYLSTDIQASEVPGLALLAARHVDHLRVRSAVLGHPATIDWVTPDGAQVLLLDPARSTAILDAVLAAPDDPPSAGASAGAAALTLFDATGQSGWGPVLAARLEEAGLPVGAVETRAAGPQSMLFYTAAAESGARAAAEALGLPQSAVRPDTDWPGPRPAETPIWVHVGSDWQPCPSHQGQSPAG